VFSLLVAGPFRLLRAGLSTAWRKPRRPELKLRAEQPKPAKSGLSARLSGRSGRFQRPLTAQPGAAPGNPAYFGS